MEGGGGQVKFYPRQKGVGVGNILVMLKGELAQTISDLQFSHFVTPHPPVHVIKLSNCSD